MPVRRLKSSEGESIRALRLRALRDTPHAFGSSFETENAYAPERWSALAEQSEHADSIVVFVATKQTSWIGMAGGYLQQDDPTVANVWGMWVEKHERRHGLGRQLLEAVEEWALTRGVTRLELSVTERAPAAAALYRTLGFTDTGVGRPLASDPSITEIVMARVLRPGQRRTRTNS